MHLGMHRIGRKSWSKFVVLHNPPLKGEAPTATKTGNIAVNYSRVILYTSINCIRYVVEPLSSVDLK